MTAAERAWIDAVVRIGHKATIGLCATHHRAGVKTERFVSRHPWRQEFERRYGTEAELLAWTRERVAKQEMA